MTLTSRADYINELEAVIGELSNWMDVIRMKVFLRQGWITQS